MWTCLLVKSFVSEKLFERCDTTIVLHLLAKKKLKQSFALYGVSTQKKFWMVSTGQSGTRKKIAQILRTGVEAGRENICDGEHLNVRKLEDEQMRNVKNEKM